MDHPPDGRHRRKRRRCLHLHIDFPDAAREREIVELRVPGAPAQLAAELVEVVQAVRAMDLKKKPSVAETLDWARALIVLNAPVLDETLVRDTLNVILKYEGDVEQAEQKLGDLLARARAAGTVGKA